MPKTATFNYRACSANKRVCTGFDPHTVDDGCSDLKPGYCHVTVSLSDPYHWAEIQHVDWFQDTDQVWMPEGASYNARGCDANKQNCTGFTSHGVDCSGLVYPKAE
jgi:hypothetical protein